LISRGRPPPPPRECPPLPSPLKHTRAPFFFAQIIAFVKNGSGPKKVVEYDGAREEDAFKTFITAQLGGSGSASVGADGETDDLEL
jgi:hypothetical protein